MVDLDGCNVLVVEDDWLIADDISRELRDMKATVVGPVASMEDARRLTQSHLLDVAVLDVNVRGLRSYPLAKDLDRAGVPVIFATGYGRDAMPADFHDNLHCEKPALAGAIGSLVAQAYAGRAL